MCVPQDGEASYQDRIRDMMTRKETRLDINLDHLRSFDVDLTQRSVLPPDERRAP